MIEYAKDHPFEVLQYMGNGIGDVETLKKFGIELSQEQAPLKKYAPADHKKKRRRGLKNE